MPDTPRTVSDFDGDRLYDGGGEVIPTTPWIVEADDFWDTHCVDCSHDMHPMDVCSAVVGGDQNGPEYCSCTLDYQALAAEYQRARGLRAALREVPRHTTPDGEETYVEWAAIRDLIGEPHDA